MFGLGTTELLVIAGVVILLFGGKKLPQLGRSMGGFITNFKKGLNEPPQDNSDNQSNDKQDS
jgi:sec-independent protein translocase protein TatA